MSRKNPVLDQQKFGRVDQGEAAFPLSEDKRRRNRLSPAKRRVAGIGGVIPRPEESQPRATVPAVRLPWATKKELIMVATMISRMIGTPVFSDRTEFPVTTARKKP